MDPTFQAVVAPPGHPVPGGLPRYSSLAQAVAQAPREASGPFRIAVAPGTYREKLTVDRPGVQLIGPPLGCDGLPAARIVWDDCASTPGPDGKPLGTFASQTLAVLAPDFRAERLEIANDWDYRANAARDPGDPARAVHTQAVALKTDGDSRRAAFLGCRLTGFQDTVFANAGTQLFRNCTVEGHVDFIFGAGQAVFQDCRILCRDRPGEDPAGWVCAPSTRSPHDHGFLFHRCRIEGAGPETRPRSFALGRPWHPSSAPDTLNIAVFRECWLGDCLAPRVWTGMGSRPGGIPVWYPAEEARLAEYRNTGPGSAEGPSADRPFLSDQEAAAAVPGAVLGGWDPGPETVSLTELSYTRTEIS